MIRSHDWLYLNILKIYNKTLLYGIINTVKMYLLHRIKILNKEGI